MRSSRSWGRSRPPNTGRTVGGLLAGCSRGRTAIGAGPGSSTLSPGSQSRRSDSLSGKASVLFWATLIVALAWLQVRGRLALGLSVALGAVALVLLPGALVALVVTRRIDAPDLAGIDVWRIATRGRLPGC